MSSQFALLKQRRFAPFFATQFLGAFNDNVFKNALVVMLTFQAASWTEMSVGVLSNLAAGIFILPFFLFSATAGQIADKYDKARLARLVKVLEMAIMLVAGLGFWLHSLAVLLGALFLLGLHSTVFGPVKYAILPQHLREDELVGGNALVEAGTFVAILAGTLFGGLLAGAGHPGWIAFSGFAIAALGYATSRGIPAAPAPEPGLRVNPNPITETWRNILFARENRSVFLAILGISWFWLYGALFLAQFPAYAKNVLGGGESAVTLLLATFTIGIGVGSLLCERLSHHHLELGLVPFGSIGLTLFGLDIAWASPAAAPLGEPLTVATLLAQLSTWRILADLLLLGLFGGFFIVPLYALMQQRSSEAHRARIVAANNILNACFMVGGALAAASLLGKGLSIAALFGVAALCNAAVALYIYRLLPEFLHRFLAWIGRGGKSRGE
ncbi:MAG: MFS transporter [Rhodocyclaceae bacterium]|nr:MFS transporter [Rhodocyclaceae bacterium]